MKFQKETNTHENSAYAPYNFVPLPEKVIPVVSLRGCESEADFNEAVEALPAHDHYLVNDDGMSGYFDVTLTTVTPLFIRAPLSVERFAERQSGDRASDFRKKAKNTPDFFYTNDPTVPRIPGSSLRGMLRSLLEIVSYGKLQPVSPRQLIYRAVGDISNLGDHYREQMLGKNKSTKGIHLDYPSPLLKGGYLRYIGSDDPEQSGWVLQPALEHHNESFVHIDEKVIHNAGFKVQPQKVYSNIYVDPVPRQALPRDKQGKFVLDIAVTDTLEKTPKHGLVEATLIISGYMQKKHWHCAIYAPDTTAEPILISQTLWRRYEEDRELTRGIATRPLRSSGDPLFYLLNAKGELVFFGPTKMFRLPYLRTPSDLIPPDLCSPHDIDFAEALFGFVRSQEQRNTLLKSKTLQEKIKQGHRALSYAGRISVGDAVLDDKSDDVFEEVVVPHILASPKPTTFQHYLTQNTNERKKLSFYDKNASLRGHKLYWRQEIDSIDAVRETQDTIPVPRDWDSAEQKVRGTSTQHTQMRPLKVGKKFKFRIYFENLRAVELGAMAWVLLLPGEEGCVFRHMLGMGKPFGMGIVELTPELTLINRETRYTELFDENNCWATGEQKQSDGTSQEYARQFETFILETLGQSADQRLHHLPRIQALMGMLEVTEPAHTYMSLQEFRQRWVLPLPTFIAERARRAQQQAENDARAEQARIERTEREARGPQPPEVSQLVRGTVLGEMADGFIELDLRDMPPDYYGLVPPEHADRVHENTTQFIVLEVSPHPEDASVMLVFCRAANKDEKKK